MNDNLGRIYATHHLNNRPSNFSILEKERGALLNKYIGINKNVLDLGCRNGILTQYFAKNNNVLGVDIDKNALEKASNMLKIDTLVIDLNSNWQELDGKKFDVIVLGEVLEHLYFPGDVLEKIKKYLNDDGIFIGSVPNAFSLKNRFRYLFAKKKNTPLGDPTHINHFSYFELEDLLKKYFSSVEIIGLGRHKNFIKINKNFFAFDLFFVCR